MIVLALLFDLSNQRGLAEARVNVVRRFDVTLSSQGTY